MSRKRQRLICVIAPLGLAAALWTVLAARAGTFIPHDERLAVQPGEFSPDAMASAKRLLSIDGHQVAYIDIGAGEPIILLHGCPFSAFEWRDVAPVLARKAAYEARQFPLAGQSTASTAVP